MSDGSTPVSTGWQSNRVKSRGLSLYLKRNATAANSVVWTDWILGSGGSAITGALFSDSDTFGAASLSTSATVTGGTFSNANTFAAATVSTSVTVTGVLFSNANSFEAATVSASGTSQNITGDLVSDADTFFVAAVSLAVVPLTGKPVKRRLRGRPINWDEEPSGIAARQAANEAREIELQRIAAEQAERLAMLAREQARAKTLDQFSGNLASASAALRAMEQAALNAAIAAEEAALNDDDEALFVMMAA